MSVPLEQMMWNDFLNKIKEFKRKKVRTGLSAPALIKLLYSGAFDSMIPQEMFKISAPQRYEQLTKELLHAMGSTAQLPKPTSVEPIGLKDVKSPAHLMLWRYVTNPIVEYNITDYCVSFLKTMGFERPSSNEKKNDPGLLWVKRVGEHNSYKTQIDIRYKWSSVFNPNNINKYISGPYLVGIVGIITKATKRCYQISKESMIIQLFTGNEYTEELRMWPDEYGKLDKSKIAFMTEMSMGLAIVKPKLWKTVQTATILDWFKIWS